PNLVLIPGTVITITGHLPRIAFQRQTPEKWAKMIRFGDELVTSSNLLRPTSVLVTVLVGETAIYDRCCFFEVKRRFRMKFCRAAVSLVLGSVALLSLPSRLDARDPQVSLEHAISVMDLREAGRPFILRASYRNLTGQRWEADYVLQWD